MRLARNIILFGLTLLLAITAGRTAHADGVDDDLRAQLEASLHGLDDAGILGVLAAVSAPGKAPT